VQFDKLVQLIRWCGSTHNIPMKLVTSTSDRGIGYHRQFARWNPNNHSCPGDVRLAKLKNELLPALQGDALTDAQAMWVHVLDASSQTSNGDHLPRELPGVWASRLGPNKRLLGGVARTTATLDLNGKRGGQPTTDGHHRSTLPLPSTRR
jgi:hypothetical protein